MMQEMPREVCDIIADLSVISGTPTGSKLNILSGTYTAANSYAGALSRMWAGERRDLTIDHIDNTLSVAADVARRCPAWRNKIAEYVGNLNGALTNLAHTYHTDAKIVGRIRALQLKGNHESFMRATNCEMIPEPTSPIAIKSRMNPESPAPLAIKDRTTSEPPSPINPDKKE